VKTFRDLSPEITYRTSRSSGSGGQHVNKVATKVELLFDIPSSKLLSDEEKKLLAELLHGRTDSKGILRLSCSETRSQFKNKEMVTLRFYRLVASSLKRRKKRIRTAIPYGVKEKRLRDKKRKSEIKKNRRAGD
jgi:ribosome-associated protein